MTSAMASQASRLVLGTANFGSEYGVVGKAVKVKSDEIARILDCAEAADIKLIDTALAYSAEEVLGQQAANRFSFVTKIQIQKLGSKGHSLAVKDRVRQSLSRLKLDSFHAVLLHDPEHLNRETSWCIDALQELKQEGLTEKIGISIYEPETLERVWGYFQPDIMQAPVNVLDARLGGWLHQDDWKCRVQEAGVEIHARSVFLQGLLLLSRDAVPAWLEPRAKLLDNWFDWVESQPDWTALELALNHVASQAWVGKIVVGVNSAQHLQRLVEIMSAEIMNAEIMNVETMNQERSAIPAWPEVGSADTNIIDPRTWPAQ